MIVRDRTPADQTGVAAFLTANHSLRVARLGALRTPLEHPALVAVDGSLAGVLTYILDGPACEILTLHAAARWRGTGTALLDTVLARTRQAGCRRLWLITTNDNVDATRRTRAVHGTVTASVLPARSVSLMTPGLGLNSSTAGNHSEGGLTCRGLVPIPLHWPRRAQLPLRRPGTA